MENVLEIPDPINAGGVIRFDLTEIHHAESRIPEISSVNGVRAQELMGFFSKACFLLGRILPTLHMNHRLAEKKVGDRSAVVVIDVMTETIKSKGLSNNDTTRQAILDLDPLYSQAVTDEIKTQAALLYVERKLRDMEGAFHATKEIHKTMSGLATRPNPMLPHELSRPDKPEPFYPGTPDAVPVRELTEGERIAMEPSPEPVKVSTTRPIGNMLFGKAKY